MSKMLGVELKTPITEEAVRKVKSGDLIYLTGHLWTVREGALKRLFIDDVPVPWDTKKYNIMQIGGQMMMEDKEGNWIPPSLGAGSTGVRFGKFVPLAIEQFRLRAVGGGKDAYGDIPEVIEACKKYGCITYTTWPRTLPGSRQAPPEYPLARRAKAVMDVHWLDLGKNDATWLFEVEKMGPMICNIDTNGNIHMNKGGSGVGSADNIDKRAAELYKKRGLDKFTGYALDREHPRYRL